MYFNDIDSKKKKPDDESFSVKNNSLNCSLIEKICLYL
jgi:hypothetical protein